MRRPYEWSKMELTTSELEALYNLAVKRLRALRNPGYKATRAEHSALLSSALKMKAELNARKRG